MNKTTGISWTDHTWNPWQGCKMVSAGCAQCYMFRDMRRYGKNPDVVTLSKPQTFNNPLRWNAAAKAAGRIDRVFVASWADFFSAEADEWRPAAWSIMRGCDSLVFQVLTKRHGRIAKNLPSDWGPGGYPNVWLGVTAEDREWWDRRARALVQVPAAVRFISYEPALGSISGMSAAGIQWVIIGGESGAKSPAAEYRARPFDLAWAREAIAICRRDGAAPFVKQLGTLPYASVSEDTRGMGGVGLALRDPHGGDMSEWPEDLRVREWPEWAR